MNGWNEWLQGGADFALLAARILSFIYFLLTLVSLIMRRLHAVPPRPLSTDFPRVTVQIPTYNELAALTCAEHCLAFDYPKDRLQILIGDDSSRKDISEQINAFAAQNPGVTLCRRGNNSGFKPGNLNHMLQQTSGDYILVLDSDFLPEKDFLRRLVQPVIQDPRLAGVQAAWRISNVHQNLTTLMGAGIVYVIHVVILPFIQRFARTGVFCGSAELIRKDLLLASGGWTAGAFTEDVDYSLRVFTKGYHITYLEEVTCTCEVPYTPGDLFRQQMRWAYGVMRAFMCHGWRLLCSRVVHFRAKLAALCFGGGYLMVFLMLLSIFLAGAHLVLDSGADPVTEPVATAGFLLDTAGNFLFTCGMLISSLCASFVAGVSLRNVGKLVLASLSLGVVLLFFVGKGLFRALFGLPMQWFMVRKNGNEGRPA